MNDTNIDRMTGQQFNSVTPENEMKWSETEAVRGKLTYEHADAIVAYAQKHNMNIRGHNLLWHEQVPSWVSSLNKTELHAAMVKRVV